MSKLIITTVGTSVIGNKLYPNKFEKNYIKELTEDKKLRPEIRSMIIDRTVENIIQNVSNNLPKNMWSAEISSIKAFKFNKDLGLNEEIVIALFSTETEDGKFCAEVNKKVLDKLGWCKVLDPIPITGLKTKSKSKPNEAVSKNFLEVGLQKLNEEVDKLLKNPDYTQNYFNITGGFKAVIPIATIIAFEREMSLIYLYEESDDLIVMNPPPKDKFILPPHIIKCSFEETIKGMKLYGCRPIGELA